MGLYDGIKDVAKVLQQVDNVDLYMKLLDLSAQALDMQQEIDKLRDENKRLSDISELERKIERIKLLTVVTLNDDEEKIPYCSRCWDTDRKLVQIIVKSDGQFTCPSKECQNQGMFDSDMNKQYHKRQTEAMGRMFSGLSKNQKDRF